MKTVYLLVATLVASALIASRAAAGADIEEQAAAPAPVAGGGMRVFIDPETKRLRQPDVSELAKLATQERRIAPVAPMVRAMPNGSLSVVLDDSFASYLVATRQPDGSFRVDCLPEKAAEAAGSAPKKPDGTQRRVLDVQ